MIYVYDEHFVADDSDTAFSVYLDSLQLAALWPQQFTKIYCYFIVCFTCVNSS